MAAYQRTLLQIINAAQQELGLPQATTAFGNSDATTVQMIGLANMEVEDLYRRQDNGWSFLRKEFNIAVQVPITNLTGNTVSGSPVITGITPNTSALTANIMTVSGAGVPTPARIQSVDSSSQITMQMQATATANGVALTFAQDTYKEPADFGFFINRTWWDRTNHWELLGPDSPQLDQWHRSGIVATGPRRHYRQIGAFDTSNPSVDSALFNFRLWPPPNEISAPIQLVFEYVSNGMVFVNGTSTTAAIFANDADIPVINDRAIIMGIKWRFWQQKGFDWTMLRTDYDNFVDRLIARDGGRETLNLVQRVNPIFISPANVQDGFFPGPVGPNTG